MSDSLRSCTRSTPSPLPCLNDYLAAEHHNMYKAAAIKKEYTELVAMLFRSAPKGLDNVNIRFQWYEKDRRRDPDNICFARKFILDGLVAAGVISGDGWKYLNTPKPFDDVFIVDAANPRVVVTVTENR